MTGSEAAYSKRITRRCSPSTQGSARKFRPLLSRKKDKAERRRRIKIFLHMLEEQKGFTGFELGMLVALVDKVIVQRNGSMEFCFKNEMKCEHPQ